ncbi:MAG: hypothetical protein L7U62_07035 [Candidatus Poseidoniaceae archaeon]|nr:hypothetical protein [Candidatus Poseidoniaceae archaeon]
MAEESPKFTMVKSQELADPPTDLSPKSRGLLDTLTMLCSFYSSEDLASFLHSDMFEDLTRQGEGWAGFEIGLYIDHTKTFEVFPSKKELLFADGANTGAFENNLYRCVEEKDTAAALEQWFQTVLQSSARFE